MDAEQERKHMWKPSPSPKENWDDAEGANEAGEWPVKGIVGEEIRLDGTSRYSTFTAINDGFLNADPQIRSTSLSFPFYLLPASRPKGEVGKLASS